MKDLARLSLKDPLYVSVHENAVHATPEKLEQIYIVCNLEDKITVLWSFIRQHLQQKTIVFLSTCKQVILLHKTFMCEVVSNFNFNLLSKIKLKLQA